MFFLFFTLRYRSVTVSFSQIRKAPYSEHVYVRLDYPQDTPMNISKRPVGSIRNKPSQRITSPAGDRHNLTEDKTSKERYAEGKNPVVAAFLSFFIPGTGQFYNGDWGKGWFLLITCIITTIFSFGTMWLVWALMAPIDAYMVASKKRPLSGSFFKF
jgi:TM2 domain-containing membrane protein YozV